jgi:hypothetical protein
LYGYETRPVTLREGLKLRVFENSVLTRISEPKSNELTRNWRKLHDENFGSIILAKHCQCVQMKKNEMGGACSAHGELEMCKKL